MEVLLQFRLQSLLDHHLGDSISHRGAPCARVPPFALVEALRNWSEDARTAMRDEFQKVKHRLNSLETITSYGRSDTTQTHSTQGSTPPKW